jgi:hypothetical protein
MDVHAAKPWPATYHPTSYPAACNKDIAFGQRCGCWPHAFAGPGCLGNLERIVVLSARLPTQAPASAARQEGATQAPARVAVQEAATQAPASDAKHIGATQTWRADGATLAGVGLTGAPPEHLSQEKRSAQVWHATPLLQALLRWPSFQNTANQYTGMYWDVLGYWNTET